MGEYDRVPESMTDGSFLRSESFSRADELPLERDPFFCGRTPELAHIAEALLFYDDIQDVQDTSKIIILSGEAGIGKTSLALEFCYRYRMLWPAILWLHGETQYPGRADARRSWFDSDFWTQHIKRVVQRTSLIRHEMLPPLLVIDHLQDLRQIQDWPVMFRGFCVLITTQSEVCTDDLQPHVYPLERPGLAESVEILRKQAGWADQTSDGALNALAVLLERHPVSLRLAGLSLAGTREEDLSLFISNLEKQERLFNHPRPEHPENLSPDWKMPVCWTVFSQYFLTITDHPERMFLRKVFAACGYCAPCTPLPGPVLAHVLGCKPVDCEQALKTLVSLGLLAEGRQGPVILETMAEYARYIDVLEGWNTLEKMVAVWDEGLPNFLAEDRSPFDARLSAHLLYLVDIGERNHIRAIGSLWYALAHTLQERGAYAQAEMYYLNALDDDIAAFGTLHMRVAILYYHLGNLAQLRGDLEKARSNYERALENFSDLLAATDPLIQYTASKLDRLREIS